MAFVLGATLVIATVLVMEGVAWAVHKYVMHGPGWGWHRSHHEPSEGWFEVNDLYSLLFAGITVGIFIGLTPFWPMLWWIAIGATLYGILYVLVHDGLVHQRWPFRHQPKHPYLKRLVQAHRLHHAVPGRDRCVSFGFLYAPPVRSLKQSLTRLHPGGLRGEPAE
jgi:beta-carotene 3-hydroxylase